MSLPRVAVVCDLLEENWPSMDLVAEMLLENLESNHRSILEATMVRPPMVTRFSRRGFPGDKKGARNGDRFLNRFWDYSRHIRKRREEFDLFHIVDHSYAQLVHHLPPESTVVTCHDLDTFQCLLNPERERRSRFFRLMTGRILSGFQKAARVTCDSHATREQLLAHNLVPPERVSVVALGIHPSCRPEADAESDARAASLLGPCEDGTIEVLHVGSTIERKRIDVLLNVIATVRKKFPRVRLVRVGGAFTREQAELAGHLKLSDSIIVLPFLEREVLAAVYRRAAIVVQPSEQEGFGLPVAEAMACGTPVVASDLPVLREVGGEAVDYCAVADVEAWSETIVRLLTEREREPCMWRERRRACLAQSSKFSWAEYARKMVAIYQELL